MEAVSNDFWVFIEANEDGTAKDVSIELLTPGRQIANQHGGELVAVVLGNHTELLVKEVSSHGADIVILIENSMFVHRSKELYVDTLFNLLEKYRPTLFMIGATDFGREIDAQLTKKIGLDDVSLKTVKIELIKEGIHCRPEKRKNAAIIFRESVVESV